MTARRLVAEALGTGLVVTAVVGSGIMADRLTADVAQTLLANTIATAAALLVLITILAPLSAAHFNPVVTLGFAVRHEIAPTLPLAFVVAQITGGVAASLLARAMFELPIWQASTTQRSGTGQWIAEGVATFGLRFAILGAIHARAKVALMVAAYIASACWFIASTSFANPAVRLRGPSQTRSPAFDRLICRASGWRRLLARFWPQGWRAGCSPMKNPRPNGRGLIGWVSLPQCR